MESLPLVIEATENQPLLDWAQQRTGEIRSTLPVHGALLFRGFEGTDIDNFQQFIELLYGPLIPYTDRGTPRREVKGRIYTATELAPQIRIFMHNENTFAAQVPGQLFFFCNQPAKSGGATPLADVRKVLGRIHPEIRRRFRDRQVLFVRNFGRGFGMPWQEAFQVKDRQELEARCRRENIDTEWIGESRLRTRQKRPALARHPQTGEQVWLNHIALLHVSTLDPMVRSTMLKLFNVADLPNNTYYGDGQSIEPEIMDAVREAYDQETRRFEWRAGDVLLLDNLLVAHGRDPFEGEREVVVGMTGPVDWGEIGIVEGDTQSE